MIDRSFRDVIYIPQIRKRRDDMSEREKVSIDEFAERLFNPDDTRPRESFPEFVFRALTSAKLESLISLSLLGSGVFIAFGGGFEFSVGILIAILGVLGLGAIIQQQMIDDLLIFAKDLTKFSATLMGALNNVASALERKNQAEEESD